MQHCVLASCRTMKEDEDCQAENPPECLGYPCISKDIETSNWCKQPMGEEEINASRMQDDSQSHTEPLMLTQEAKRDCRRQAICSYKLQLLTTLNNCYKLQQLTLNSWCQYLWSLQKEIGLLDRAMDLNVLQCFLLEVKSHRLIWIKIRSFQYYLNPRHMAVTFCILKLGILGGYHCFNSTLGICTVFWIIKLMPIVNAAQNPAPCGQNTRPKRCYSTSLFSNWATDTRMLESSPQCRVGQVPHCMLDLSFR